MYFSKVTHANAHTRSNHKQANASHTHATTHTQSSSPSSPPPIHNSTVLRPRLLLTSNHFVTSLLRNLNRNIPALNHGPATRTIQARNSDTKHKIATLVVVCRRNSLDAHVAEHIALTGPEVAAAGGVAEGLGVSVGVAGRGDLVAPGDGDVGDGLDVVLCEEGEGEGGGGFDCVGGGKADYAC
jgi:hypothetical protein